MPIAYGALVRQLLLIISGALVTRGLLEADQAAPFVDHLTTLISAAVGLGTLVYGQYKQRPAAVIDKASKLPEVAKVVTTDQQLADGLSAKVVGPRG